MYVDKNFQKHKQNFKKEEEKEFLPWTEVFWSVSSEWAFISSRTRGHADKVANKHFFPSLCNLWPRLSVDPFRKWSGESCGVLVFPWEPPGFLREKPRSEFSFLLEALGEGKQREKPFESVWRMGMESTRQKERCFRVTLMSSAFTCFHFICMIVWIGSTHGAQPVSPGLVGTWIRL